MHIIYSKVQMDIGDRYVEQERYSDAIKEYDRYIQQYPSVPAAHSNKAYCLVKLGQMIHALPQYEAALKLDPNNPNAHFNVGYVLSQLNKHEQALKAFDASLKLKQSDVGFFNRGNELSYLGRLEQAIAAYEAAIKLNPKNENAKLNRDNCIVALKMHCDKYKKKISTKTNSEYTGKTQEVLQSQANFSSTTSPYEARLAALTAAINSNPGDVLAYCNRAAIYLRMGKSAEFENDVQWAIKSLTYGDIKNLNASQKSFLVQFLMQYTDVMQSLKQVAVSHNLTPEQKMLLQKEAGAIFVGAIKSIQEAPQDTNLQTKDMNSLKSLNKNIQQGLTGKKEVSKAQNGT